MLRTSVPPVNLANAIKIYYTKTWLAKSDAAEIFTEPPGSTVWRKMKAAALEEMLAEKDKLRVFDTQKVLTRCAFKAWDLDIDELEAKYKKLKKLGLLEEMREKTGA